ncbi:serine/threonine-protein kinase warts [Anaeramoeba flamelloides]|uniref:non-specific serine/threonine protein kinase n=1 Tax=Anaeramoeba flamelloides TaxID=1746091 RepID=A0AAV7YRM1_9EUKA|nr:serine/threonine-protein kinase warts [Anaeramoeba flamelloides]
MKSNYLKQKQNENFLKNLKSLKVSNETKRRTKLLVSYLNNFYTEKSHYHYCRKERLKELKDSLVKCKSLKEAQQKIQRHNHKETKYLRLKRIGIRTNNYTFLAKIGEGAFADVYLAVQKDNLQLTAIKVISKEKFANEKQINRIETERNILISHSSKWLVKAYNCFQDSHSLYFAIEFVQGGDLSCLLSNAREFISWKIARFFFANVLLAIRDLHLLGFIHRDLKPDNFLISADGYLKLADFGLSKDLSLFQQLIKFNNLEFSRKEKDGNYGKKNNDNKKNRNKSPNLSKANNNTNSDSDFYCSYDNDTDTDTNTEPFSFPNTNSETGSGSGSGSGSESESKSNRSSSSSDNFNNRLNNSSSFLIKEDLEFDEEFDHDYDEFEKTLENSKKFCQLAQSKVGTIEYMAPEVFLNQGEGYDQAIDFWACGVILFLLIYGKLPFKEDSQLKTIQKIIQFDYQLKKKNQFGKKIPKMVRDLISKLLRNKKKRLSFKGIISHSFFSDFDWQRFQEKKIVPPFKPYLQDNLDISCFDTSYFERGNSIESIMKHFGTKKFPSKFNRSGKFTGITYHHFNKFDFGLREIPKKDRLL